MRRHIIAVIGSLLFALSCAPPSPEELAAKTGESASALMMEAWEASEVSNQMGAVDSCTTSANATNRAFTKVETDMARPRMPDSVKGRADLKVYQDLLSTQVFTRDNFEYTEGNATYFRLNSSVCAKKGTVAKQDCVDFFTQTEIRLRVVGDPDTRLDVTVIVGPQRYEPVTFTIEKDKALGSTMDLGQARLAALYIETKRPGFIGSEFPEMEGTFELRLEKNAPKDFQLTYTVHNDLKLRVVSKQIVRTYTQQASAASVLRLDANNRRWIAEWNLGKVTYTGPATDFHDDARSSEAMSVELAGLNANMVLQDGVEEFLVGSLGFGDAQSRLVFNNQTIIGADFNQTMGRKVDFRVKLDTDQIPLITMTPGAEVKVLVNWAPVEAIGFPHSDVQNETITASLKGDGKVVVKPLPKSGGQGGGLQIVAGTLVVSTTRVNVGPVTITAGQCFDGRADVSAEGHSILGALQTVTCQ